MPTAAQHCIGADGTKVIGGSSSLSAAAQLHHYAAKSVCEDAVAIASYPSTYSYQERKVLEQPGKTRSNRPPIDYLYHY